MWVIWVYQVEHPFVLLVLLWEVIYPVATPLLLDPLQVWLQRRICMGSHRMHNSSRASGLWISSDAGCCWCGGDHAADGRDSGVHTI